MDRTQAIEAVGDGTPWIWNLEAGRRAQATPVLDLNGSRPAPTSTKDLRLNPSWSGSLMGAPHRQIYGNRKKHHW